MTLREEIEAAMELLEQLPIDYEADIEDTSPEDNIAHTAGLVYQCLARALYDVDESESKCKQG